MLPVSVVIVAKDEEALIRNCVAPLVDHFNEVIVVVDSRSKDGTQKIAQELGCQVELFHHPDTDVWLESAMRNNSISYASSPWILLLDCDERIEPEDFRLIHEKIGAADEDTVAIRFPRFDYLGRGKWATVPLIRLIRNRPDIRFNNVDIHTSLCSSILASKGKMETIHVPIHHLDILIADRTIQKRSHYITKLQTQLRRTDLQRDEYSDVHLFLGLEYTARGEYDRAEQHIRTAIELAPTINGTLGGILLCQNFLAKGDLRQAKEAAYDVMSNAKTKLEAALVVLAEVALRTGHLDKAVTLCEEALELNPQASHLHLNLASLLQNVDCERALIHLHTAMKLHRFLANPLIYRDGAVPNLFSSQTSFLSSTQTIFEHFIYCYRSIGKIDVAAKWQSKYDEIMLAASTPIVGDW